MSDAKKNHDEMLGLRKALGLSQQEFADALQLHRSTLSNYETGGTPWPKVFIKTAHVLLHEFIHQRYHRHLVIINAPLDKLLAQLQLDSALKK